MPELILIRHGQASFGQKVYDQLSDLGYQQALCLGEHFANIGQEFDAIYSGQMQRQQKTAEGVLAGMKEGMNPSLAIQENIALNEFDADGIFYAYLPSFFQANPDIKPDARALFKDRILFQKAYEHVVDLWVQNAQGQTPIAETWQGFIERVQDGVSDLLNAHGRTEQVALVTSGGPITVLVRQALNLDNKATFQLNARIHNASVTRLRVGKHRALISFNDVAHLQLKDSNYLTLR